MRKNQENPNQENLLIKDTGIVIGDGRTILEKAHVVISGQRISYAGREKPAGVKFANIVEGQNNWTLPGIINIHTHGNVPGAPLFSSASRPPPHEVIERNLKRHLSQGTTTLLNLDGFAAPEKVTAAQKLTPINIKTGSTHYHKAYLAAKKSDGQGLEAQKELEISELVQEHPDLIVAVGEAGSGATLGGGVQDYKYIPEMIKKETGAVISEAEARGLKEAVLGREISSKRFDPKKVAQILRQVGLGDYSAGWAREKIEETVLPGFKLSLESLDEGAKIAQKYQLPYVVHTALPSRSEIEALKSLGPLLVAGHVNHPSFELAEAITLAKKLKQAGVFIDISTFDTLQSHQRAQELELFFRFLEEGLADTISTDYGGGNHSPILRMVELALAEGAVSLPEAVIRLTSIPAQVIPGLAPERGLVKEGFIADLVMVNREKISQVDKVYIGGEDCTNLIPVMKK